MTPFLRKRRPAPRLAFKNCAGVRFSTTRQALQFCRIEISPNSAQVIRYEARAKSSLTES